LIQFSIQDSALSIQPKGFTAETQRAQASRMSRRKHRVIARNLVIARSENQIYLAPFALCVLCDLCGKPSWLNADG
jgi:hypothetical protein